MEIIVYSDKPKLFEIGELVATPSIVQDLSVETSVSLVKRHISGDYGDLCLSDKKLNNHALKNGGTIFSSYIIDKEKVYIITEHDRSVTTVLYSHEY